MARSKQQEVLLKALKLELEFCEQGGYKPAVAGRFPARSSEIDPMSTFLFAERHLEHRERSTFRDSPSCLNYGLEVREHPCSNCWLMNFVPPEKRGEEFPCHHIPLNERGDTAATLGVRGDAPEVQAALLAWLRRTIQELEEAPGESQATAA